jgi:hypothetical protein
MPQGREGDAHVRDLGPVLGCAAGALDTGVTQRRSRWRTLVVRAPGGRQEPGGVPRGFPGGAPQRQGLFGERTVTVLGALAAGDMALEALPVPGRALQEEGCMKPEARARDGRAGDVGVHGGSARKEARALLPTEDSGEPVGGLGTQE